MHRDTLGCWCFSWYTERRELRDAHTIQNTHTQSVNHRAHAHPSSDTSPRSQWCRRSNLHSHWWTDACQTQAAQAAVSFSTVGQHGPGEQGSRRVSRGNVARGAQRNLSCSLVCPLRAFPLLGIREGRRDSLQTTCSTDPRRMLALTVR